MASLEHIANPTDLDFANVTVAFPKVWEDYVEVKWDRQVYDGKRIIRWHLDVQGEDLRVERYFDYDETSYRVAGLRPGHSVSAKVRVETETASKTVSWSPWASSSVTTLAATRVEVGTVGAASLEGSLVWADSPLVDEGPSPTQVAVEIATFDIHVEQRGKVVSHEAVKTSAPGSERSFHVPDMDSNSIFYVKARAVSIFGDKGAWSAQVRFLTLPPVLVSVSDIAETEALLQWSRGEDDGDTMSISAVEELLLIIEQLPSQRELDIDAQTPSVRIDAQSFGNETRQYTVKNLTPGREYAVKSRYRNILGHTTPWSTTQFQALHPVLPVDVQVVGHNFIQMQWRRDINSGDPISKGALGVKAWEVRCSVGKSHTAALLPASEMETKLLHLHHGVDYTVDVRAVTPTGQYGLWSLPMTVTTLHKLSPRVAIAGETWLRVAWDRKERQYKDNITRFHVQLSAVDSPFRLAKYFAATLTDHVFNGLKPDTKYFVAIQAYSDDRWGPWSEAVEVATCSQCTPVLARRGEDFLQLRWASEYYERCSVDTVKRQYQLRVTRPPVGDRDTMATGGTSVEAVKDVIGAVRPTESEVLTVEQPALRLRHLPPNSRCIIQLRCFDYSLSEWSGWGPETEFKTLPPVITLTHVGETYAEVSWPRAPRIVSAVTDQQEGRGVEDPLLPRPAKQYVLSLSSIDVKTGQQCHLRKIHIGSSEATTFTVNDLQPDLRYAIRLCFRDDEDDWSSDSAATVFRTLPRMRLCVLNIGEQHCALKWGRWVNGETLMDVAAVTAVAGISETEMNFRLMVTDMATEGNDGVNTVPPSLYSVQGQTNFVINELIPATLYKISVACAPRDTGVWSPWSDPEYVFTLPGIDASIDCVGHDFAVVSWKRTSVDLGLLSRVPGALVAKASFANKNPSPSPTSGEGRTVFIGDDGVVEYHVRVRRLDFPADADAGEPVAKTTVFDSKSTDLTARAGGLVPDTPYEVQVRAQLAVGKAWGRWSTELQIRSTMPTTVRITDINQDGVGIAWDKLDAEQNAAADADVESFQLRIQGLDDELVVTRDFPVTCHSYLLTGLGLHCVYALSVRSFNTLENAWSPWSEPTHLSLSTTALELKEAAQTWMHLQWENERNLDGRAKAQLLTVVGGGSATTVQLPADDHTYVAKELKPNALYTVQLIRVEEIPAYAVQEIQKRADGAVRKRWNRAHHNRSAEEDAHAADSANFSLPLVAVDNQAFLTDGFRVRSHRELDLRIDRVGQNFVFVKWSHQSTEDDGLANCGESDEYELEITTVDDDEPPTSVKAQAMFTFIRNLVPNSNVRIAVRKVARHGTDECPWSKAATARLLPIIDPALGPGDGSDTPGVGEDFLLVNWRRPLETFTSAQLEGVSFEVRLVPLEGPHAHVERVVSTAEAFTHFGNLTPDLQYNIQVRTVTTHRLGQTVEESRGQWSEPLCCATLSPMAVALLDVAETTALLRWRRRNCIASRDMWWQDGPEVLADEVAGISSFHVRVVAKEGSAPPVFDEQFSRTQEEFSLCGARITNLIPGTVYMASVRASTGTLWGGWSYPTSFRTPHAFGTRVEFVGETFVVAAWDRPPLEPCGRTRMSLHRLKLSDETDLTIAGADPEEDARCDSAPMGLEELQDETAEMSEDDVTVEKEQLAVQLAKPQRWEVSFKIVGAPSGTAPVLTELAAEEQSVKHCLGNLVSNTPYSFSMRALYHGGTAGTWSEPTYFVTLASILADVSKAGETFAVVSWERHLQKTVAMAMRAKHLAEERELDTRLSALELDRRVAMQEAEAAGVEVPPDDAVLPEDASPQANHLWSVQHQIKSAILRQQQSKKLTSLKIAELERAAAYPKGTAFRSEVVVRIVNAPTSVEMGGGEGGEGSDNEVPLNLEDMEEAPKPKGDEAPHEVAAPVALRRRLGRGESFCRLEGLSPLTTYRIEVRCLYGSSTPLLSSDCTQHALGDVEMTDFFVPWGAWSTSIEFTTLKPITVSISAIGSTSVAIDWDTGLRSTGSGADGTAITKFQMRVSEPVPGGKRTDVVLEDPTLVHHVMHLLSPATLYTVAVRVCYEGEKWGVWSLGVPFMTRPSLKAKLQKIEEHSLELLVWREAETITENEEIVQYMPQTTEHQLSLNGVACESTFTLEHGTSTLLALGGLSIDTSYTIAARDELSNTWQSFIDLTTCETLPRPPGRPVLTERKGTSILLSWEHETTLNRQYLVGVEIAVSQTSKRPDPDAFEPLGYTTGSTFRLECGFPLDRCFFRLRVCKTEMTVDGSPQPVLVLDPENQQNITVDSPVVYVWSAYCAPARFKTPPLPGHPGRIRIRNLTSNSATLLWDKPENSVLQSELVYRVYLNNSYADKFTCVCETDRCGFQLSDLVPNTHYRVAVSAESTMGRSANNNTLHFSTHAAEVGEKQLKPISSTLPPRNAIRPPAAFVKSVQDKPTAPDEGLGQPLMDDAASTVAALRPITSLGSDSPRSPSPRPKPFVMSQLGHGQRPLSSSRPLSSARKTLPPLPVDMKPKAAE